MRCTASAEAFLSGHRDALDVDYSPTHDDVLAALRSSWVDDDIESDDVRAEDGEDMWSATLPTPITLEIERGGQTSRWQNQATITCEDGGRRDIVLTFDPATAVTE